MSNERTASSLYSLSDADSRGGMSTALRYSRFICAMKATLMPFGQTASHSR
jgi:hypothetical protein